jgi:hypothetical protein
VLRYVRGHAAPGSTLAFDSFHGAHPASSDPDSPAARSGEPWPFGFPGESAAGWVTQQGLGVVSDRSIVELAGRCARRRDGTWAAGPPS